jgi:hypothetical protein
MCEKCVELDKKIEHYRQLSNLVSDEKAQEAIRFLVAKYHHDKRALHPGTIADLQSSNRK